VKSLGRHFVDFRATGRRGPGTWGQQQVWVDLQHLGPEQYDPNMSILLRLPEPIPHPMRTR
jgi:hypothetical protein